MRELWPNIAARFVELPGYLLPHLQLTAIALIAGLAISLPTAVILTRLRSLRYPVLTAAGVIQTVPTLALLALMVPVLAGLAPLINEAVGAEVLAAFGFWPAVIALSLYGILPILRNAVTGILDVDPNVTEAARGVGMTPWQTLRRVELPLAAPVIVAGVRTAVVWIVGIATLATPVGQACLGNYIFTGLQTRNWVMVLFGVAAAAGLAIVLDTLIGGLQRGVAERRSRLATGTGAALVAIVAVGLLTPVVAPLLQGSARGEANTATADVQRAIDRLGTIRIGAKNFNEQYVLARVIERRLNEAGFRATRDDNLGSTVGFDALTGSEIDVFVDYSGTLWANDMNRADAPPRETVLESVGFHLADTYGVRQLGPLGFENAYCLAMPRAEADELGIDTIADLVGHDDRLAIGGDFEYFDRPEWAATRDAYGLDFSERSSFAPTLMYEAVRTGRVDVIAAFSSDGRIAAFDLKVLKDPKRTIPPYDAVLLLSPRVAGSPGLAETLRPLVNAIPQDAMLRANEMVDVEGREVEAAADWLYAEAFGDGSAPAP